MRRARLDMLLLALGSSFPAPTSIKTVDEIAESYRVKLWLRPWSEMGDGRSSGKTTRLLLLALAECAADPDARVFFGVYGPYDGAENHSHARWTKERLRHLASTLGADCSRVTVTSHGVASDPQRKLGFKKVIEIHDYP